MTTPPPPRKGSSDFDKNLPPSDSLFNLVDRRPRIKPIYLGQYRWRFEGLDFPDLTIKRGADLLSRRRPEMVEFRERLKRFLGLDDERLKEELLKLGRQIDDYYRRREAEERDTERAEEILEDLPKWRFNVKLLEKAERYITEKLREIKTVEEYLKFLRDEVFKDLVAGEDDNKILMATCLQGKGFIIILPGPPSLGKSYFVDAFAECLNIYKTHRLTEHGLEHIPEDEVEGKILYVKEAEDLSDHRAYVLKSFYLDYQEDAEAFIVTYPIKDPNTGKLKSIRKRLRVDGIITTTNLEWMDRSLLERSWTINLDSSPEQTKRVLEFVGRDEDEKTKVEKGLLEWTSRQWSQALTFTLFRKVRDVDVWVPAKKDIPKIVFEKMTTELETRREARRILKFLENFAKLCSPILPTGVIGDKRLKIATEEVLLEGIKLYRKLIGYKSRIKRPAWIKFAEKLLEYYGEQGEVTIDMEKRLKLAEVFNRTEHTIYVRLSELENISHAVESYGIGRQVAFRVNLAELAVEVRGYQPSVDVLSNERVQRLTTCIKQSIDEDGVLMIDELPEENASFSEKPVENSHFPKMREDDSYLAEKPEIRTDQERTIINSHFGEMRVPRASSTERTEENEYFNYHQNPLNIERVNRTEVKPLRVPPPPGFEDIWTEVEREAIREIEEQWRAYAEGRPPPWVSNETRKRWRRGDGR